MKCYLEHVKDQSVTYWEAETDGVQVTIRTGRLGTKGKLRKLKFDRAAEATSHYKQYVRRQREIGFRDADGEIPEFDKVTHYFEKRSRKSSQFFEISINGKKLTRHTGDIGAVGEKHTFTIDSAPEARRMYGIVLEQVQKDGYREAKSPDVKPAKPSVQENAYLESKDHRRFFEIAEFNNRMTIRRGEVGKPCIVFELSWVTEGRGRESYERVVKVWKGNGYRVCKPSAPVIEGCRATELFSDEIEDHYEFGEFFGIGGAGDLIGKVHRIAYFPNGFQYDGDYDFHDVADMRLFSGLIIKGDVRVTGVLSQLTYTYPGSILILGDVYAHSLGQADSHMLIRGDVMVENIIYGHYNDGSLEISGKATGRLWYSYDHSMSASGYDIHKADWGETEGLSPKVCTLEGGVDEELIREYMFDRKSPMKPGWVRPVAHVVEEVVTEEGQEESAEVSGEWKPPETEQVEDKDAAHPRIKMIFNRFGDYDPALVLKVLERDFDRDLIRMHSTLLLQAAIYPSASFDEYAAIAQRLIELGADPRLTFDEEEQAAVSDAKFRQRREILSVFQKAFPELDCELKDEDIIHKAELLHRLIQLEDGKADFSDPVIRAELDAVYRVQLVVETLPRVPSAISELRNLVSFTLYAVSPAGLYVPDRITQLHTLETLCLMDSGFTALPDLSGMQSLIMVQLGKNKLTALPVLPKGLKLLTLNENPLKSVDLTPYAQLESLSLDGVTGSVTGFEHLKSLTTLSWSDAKLKALPEALLKSASLKMLVVNAHKITQMPDLSAMTSLRYLDLSSGPLQSLHVSLLQLPELETVLLHDCKALANAVKDKASDVQRIAEALQAKGVEITIVKDEGLSATVEETSETEEVNEEPEESSAPASSPIEKPKKKMSTRVRAVLKSIKALNEQASKMQSKKPKQALELYEQVITQAQPMLEDYADDFSYDMLFAMQGKLWCVNELVEKSPSAWTAADGQCIATEVLAFTENQGANFYYSEASALSRGSKVLAHNSLAYYGLHSAKSQSGFEAALAHVNEAISDTDYDSPPETFSVVLENKIELLLKLGRSDEAYAVVYQMNRKHPGVAYFEDITKTKAYAKWEAAN